MVDKVDYVSSSCEVKMRPSKSKGIPYKEHNAAHSETCPPCDSSYNMNVGEFTFYEVG
jgi:hypothetical protein